MLKASGCHVGVNPLVLHPLNIGLTEVAGIHRRFFNAIGFSYIFLRLRHHRQYLTHIIGLMGYIGGYNDLVRRVHHHLRIAALIPAFVTGPHNSAFRIREVDLRLVRYCRFTSGSLGYVTWILCRRLRRLDG